MLAAYVTARKKNFPVEETFNIPNVKKTAKDAALAFLLPVIILGGIFGGVVTATEGAGLAVVASLVIGFIYKEIDFKRLYESATECKKKPITKRKTFKIPKTAYLLFVKSMIDSATFCGICSIVKNSPNNTDAATNNITEAVWIAPSHADSYNLLKSISL